MKKDKPTEYLGDFGGAPENHETTPIGVAAEAERSEPAVAETPTEETK